MAHTSFFQNARDFNISGGLFQVVNGDVNTHLRQDNNFMNNSHNNYGPGSPGNPGSRPSPSRRAPPQRLDPGERQYSRGSDPSQDYPNYSQPHDGEYSWGRTASMPQSPTRPKPYSTGDHRGAGSWEQPADTASESRRSRKKNKRQNSAQQHGSSFLGNAAMRDPNVHTVISGGHYESTTTSEGTAFIVEEPEEEVVPVVEAQQAEVTVQESESSEATEPAELEYIATNNNEVTSPKPETLSQPVDASEEEERVPPMQAAEEPAAPTTTVLQGMLDRLTQLNVQDESSPIAPTAHMDNKPKLKRSLTSKLFGWTRRATVQV
ncbi:hypothetical protein HMN09_01377800 [Mycena chlorophos]|uniref:Uncharacterized protein n=1 Tax=Mycena chlorophos TaxID=658473 RepID=A0A8H6RXI4_MYCCL|nr:hypothetical protein HMN09_01377800 [Mycena chlorophos]